MRFLLSERKVSADRSTERKEMITMGHDPIIIITSLF